jgi:EAL domain-containing protein (putative c-di-GMP-specific phosphodiesterase class I)
MEVVAEGVQTAEQRERLRLLGCEYGQGFLFSEPLSADGAEELLLRRARSLSGK